MTAATCGKCKFLNVLPDSAGRIIPRKNGTYRCTVEVPEPMLPHSMTRAYGFKWPPWSKTFMVPSDGEGCPLFAPRKPGAK